MADSQRPRLPDQGVGNEKPFVIESTVRGAYKAPVEVAGIDADHVGDAVARGLLGATRGHPGARGSGLRHV